MSEDMSERNVKRYVRRYVRKNVKRYVRKNLRHMSTRCPKCQKLYQKECQTECRRSVRKNVRKSVRQNVRKNVKRYARKNLRLMSIRCRDNEKTLFFVELMDAEFKIDLKIGEDNEKIEVIRWQFPLLHGMLRTVYSAQGLTLDGGVLVDLRRAGGLEDDDWWLAMYVMLTRARKLENLILLGFTEQVEEVFLRGPPSYLRALTDKLEAKAAATLERLQNWPVYDSLQTS